MNFGHFHYRICLVLYKLYQNTQYLNWVIAFTYGFALQDEGGQSEVFLHIPPTQLYEAHVW